MLHPVSVKNRPASIPFQARIIVNANFILILSWKPLVIISIYFTCPSISFQQAVPNTFHYFTPVDKGIQHIVE